MQMLAVKFVSNLMNGRELLLSFCQTAAAVLLTALWQGALVAAGLAVFLKLTPRAAAAHRFLIWSAGFIVAIGLPFFSLASRFTATSAASGASNFPPIDKPLFIIDIRWSVLIAGFWLAASSYRAIDLAIQSMRLRRLWKFAVPLDIFLSDAAALAVSGRRKIEICSTADLERPGVIGFFAPRILIPDWLLARLTAGELDQIVLHESEHLRRGDDWTNLLQKIGLILFPINPALWWMERRLCADREIACDEGVVRITQAPRAYATCLASLAERGLEHRLGSNSFGALSLGAWHRRPELARRVHRILQKKQTIGPLGAGTLLATISVGLVFASVEFSRCPQLFAFTTPRSIDLAQSASTGVDDGVYASTRAMMAASLGSPVRLTQLKAVMPARRSIPAAFGNSPASDSTGRSSSGLRQRSDRKTSTTVAASRQQEILAGDESETHSAGQPSFIVLTAWEQVLTTPNSGPLESDQAYATQQENNAAAEHDAKLYPDRCFAIPRGRMIITQLIFRVLPAHASPHAPSAPSGLSARDAWLVLQL